ncbi:hypothetical protein PPL_05498 [Heterostelium album PN500]|uniref:Uncharacterized protein n=1 Tax=Heterostelium pallidum (strain ATCC 26659 / Pp 5 / PN500) TaxID=670386 RepID=D3BAC2_HETP5|nr:hypothetical protein PPL_05498 [Heterostelium album PN500]EFA81509.1 hypothetical protein PPL_05498 [Heterostelium album PN500]|eukprot:XP_020433626.1 hypothetical protein PPL_05498 [Heterostelium album PN500]
MLFKNIKQFIVNVQLRERDHELIEHVTTKIEYLYELYPYYCAIQEMVTPIIYHSVLSYQQYIKRKRVLEVFEEGSYPLHFDSNHSRSKINHLLSLVQHQQPTEHLYILEGITSNEIIETCNIIKNGVIYLNCLDSINIKENKNKNSNEVLVGEEEQEQEQEEEQEEEDKDSLTILNILSKTLRYEDDYNVI